MISPLFPTIFLLLARSTVLEPRLSGSYTLQPGQRNTVSTAVDLTVSRMSFLLRPLARHRLEQTNRPAQELHFNLGPINHEIRFDARAPIQTPAGGQPRLWTREDGEQFLVRTTLTDSGLIQRFEASDGSRTNRYLLDPDGLRLRLDVTVESARLPSPLTYTLIYQRRAS